MNRFEKVTIFTSTLLSGETIIHFGKPLELVNYTKFSCYDPNHIIPKFGFKIVPNFDFWRLELVARGVSFQQEVELAAHNSNGSSVSFMANSSPDNAP
jgi:hypothetical protein